MNYQAYLKNTQVIVQFDGATPPVGGTLLGKFEYPDVVYPTSFAMFHAVRDLLYKHNIQDTHRINIKSEAKPLVLQHHKFADVETGDNVTETVVCFGGLAPYTFTIETGPATAVIDSDGEITYATAAKGVHAFVIKVVDANGTVSTMEYSLTVVDP